MRPKVISKWTRTVEKHGSACDFTILVIMYKHSANKMKLPYLWHRRFKTWPQVKKVAAGIGCILSFWSTQIKWQHIPVKNWWRKTSLWLESQINLNPAKVIVLHEYNFIRHLPALESRFKHCISEKKNVMSNLLLISMFVWSLFTLQCSFYMFLCSLMMFYLEFSDIAHLKIALKK